MKKNPIRMFLMANPMAVIATAQMAVMFTSMASFALDVAKVNGKVVKDVDVKEALSQVNEGQRKNLMKDPNTRRQIVNSVIEQELLVQEAEKEKIGDTAEYKQAVEAFRKQYFANIVLQKNLGSKMTESAAKKFYEANKRNYSTDRVHALHILVADEDKARELLGQAKPMSNEDFQGLAEKFSKDPSAKNNRGDLGVFGRGRMVKEFTDAAFGASAGETIGPVKTAFGYHIIRVVEKKPGKPLNYAEVELEVKNQLRSELAQSYVGKLRQQAKIEVDEKAIDKL